jgi:tetratricopeptide (TPR) repeat protein
MDRYRLYLVSALLLAGCASVPRQAPPPARMPIPEASPQAVQPEAVQPPAAAPQAAMPALPGEGGVIVAPIQPAPEPKPEMSGNQAVIALLDLAQRDNDAGRREAAGASLERALRIEPRNPWLWHELGALRLIQGQYAQAITLAQKSTSFAGRQRRLQAMNWRLIGNAHVAQGDPAGAEQAFKQATELEQEQSGQDLRF